MHIDTMQSISLFDKIVNLLPSIVVTILLTAILGFFLRPIKRFRKHLKMYACFRKKARQLQPTAYLRSTYTWSEDNKDARLSSNEDLINQFLNFLKGRKNVLLIKGQFGIGKSSLCKYLAGNLSSTRNVLGRFVPIYIDASKINNERIATEVVGQINNSILIDLSLSDFGRLLKNKRVFLFFDGLDQLPYLQGASGILESIVQFVRSEINRRRRCKMILIVRREFFEVSPELQNFLKDYSFPIIDVKGFTNLELVTDFIQRFDGKEGKQKTEVLNELIKLDMGLLDLFKVPIILKNFIKASVQDINNLVSVGINLGRIFKLGFEKLDESIQNNLSKLGYYLFKNDRYHFSETAELVKYMEIDSNKFNKLIKSVGFITQDSGYYQFEHPTFRDYFASKRLLDAIIKGEACVFLSDRVMHYLVSEFVAGQMNESIFLSLLNTFDNTKEDLVRTNVIDIISESDNENFRRQTKEFIKRKLAEVNKTTSDWTEIKIYLYAISGIFGFLEPILELINYIQKVSTKTFLSKFYITKEAFKYYNYSQDRCLFEWARAIGSRKYGYIRILLCYLLGEMKATMAISYLGKLVVDENEENILKQYARESIDKIVGVKTI